MVRFLRKFLAIFAAVIVALVSGVVVAQADSSSDVGWVPRVYTTPGGQISGDRLWNTTCEKYSSNVVRCRANIWATQVQYTNGRYVSTTGWTFNNLTYLPSTRASWVGNNLGQNNGSWKSGDRTWRTECDTAVTGSGGCRSYVWAKQVHFEGGRYVSKSDWVFNNIVLFSTASLAPVTTVPAWIIDQSRLDFTGLVPSPIRIGASLADLSKLEYFTYQMVVSYPWIESQSLENRGIWTGSYYGDTELRNVAVTKKGIRTVDGAQIGMTLGEIKVIYGNRLRLETKESHHTMYTAVVESGGNELVFWNEYGQPDGRQLQDSDVINGMMARKEAPDFF